MFYFRVINQTGVVQWTRDGFGLGIIRRLSGFDRYLFLLFLAFWCRISFLSFIINLISSQVLN